MSTLAPGSGSAPGRRTPSPAEAMRRLEAGNAIRLQRAEQRRRFAQLGAQDGLRAAAVIVSNPAPWAQSWKVFSLLVAITGVGPSKAYRAMNACHITDNRVVGALDDRQRHDLCLWLEKRAAAWRRTGG